MPARFRWKGRAMLAASMASGAFLIAFSFSSFGVALPMLIMVSLTSMIFTTVNTTIIPTASNAYYKRACIIEHAG